MEEIETSLRELSAANIMELRAISKPNPIIEKTLQIVLSLKGFKNLNWATAKEFLGRKSIRIELKQVLSANQNFIKGEDIVRA